MRDPPRHDTAETIANVRAAGVGVKMITGDHINIARKTAEQIKVCVCVCVRTRVCVCV